MAWQPAAVEAEAYEGLRRGHEAAFRVLADPLQPTLEGLARVAVASPAEVDAVVVHAWRTALRSLDLFRWHTPFATWVARGAAVHARVLARPDLTAGPVSAGPRPGAAASGPRDWSDLPWAARWEAAVPSLRSAWSGLPLPLREVSWTHDVQRWPDDRVRDVLGWPEAVCERRLWEARGRLRDALAAVAGDDGPATIAQVERTAGVMPLLHWTPDVAERGVTPDVLREFRRWRGAASPWPRLHRMVPGLR